MSNKVLFIMIDGCRPDALQQANTPNLKDLWQTGAYTWTARSVMPSVTLPCHNSMFRGVDPARHGIGPDNVFRSSALAFPSLLDVAAMGNKHNAIFYSWEQLRDLGAPGSLKMSYCRSADYGADNDTPVAQMAADYLVTEQPDFCFLYLGDVDIHGHMYGWMSPEYMNAIEINDRAVGIVMDRLQEAGLRNSYTILVQADHGGHDTDHGTDMPEDMLIPWILNGVGIKKGYALQSPVGLVDTTATIAHLLGITAPPEWEGSPVMEAFVNGQG
ncbi:MAG: alkaline phosphatase family protein [Anaerolineae bacterium]